MLLKLCHSHSLPKLSQEQAFNLQTFHLQRELAEPLLLFLLLMHLQDYHNSQESLVPPSIHGASAFINKNRKKGHTNPSFGIMSYGSTRAKCLLSFLCLCSSYFRVVLHLFILSCCFLHFNLIQVLFEAIQSVQNVQFVLELLIFIFCVGIYIELCCYFDYTLFESCLKFYSVHMMCLESF